VPVHGLALTLLWSLLAGSAAAAVNPAAPDGSGDAVAVPPAGTLELVPPQQLSVAAAARLFERMVMRGELILFDSVMTIDRLKATQVAYVYGMDGRLRQIRVSARLTPPLPVPEASCRVISIDAWLTPEGELTESHLHVEPMAEEGA